MSGVATASITCDNCGAVLTGPFCASCGQKTAPLDPAVHDFLHDFSHEMLHVDGRIYRSVWKLLFSPGFLTREQFLGRRARWISPIRLYLVFSIAYFGIVSLTGARLVNVTTKASDAETTSGLQRLGFENEAELQKAVVEAETHWAPRAMFVFVPVFAWLTRTIWRRGKRHYPQYLYFALHVHAAWFAAGALVDVLAALAPSMSRVGSAGSMLYGYLYAVLAFRVAFAARFQAALVRMTAVVIVYFVLVGATASALAFAVIFWSR